jgi:membrane-associated protein
MTVTMGAVGYPLRRFAPIDALAAFTWALFCAGIGYVGGAAFEHEPIKGVALGLGLALAISVTVEITRHVRQARAGQGAGFEARFARTSTSEASARAELSQPTHR